MTTCTIETGQAGIQEAPLRLKAPALRQRGIKGLSKPNVPRMYPESSEREARFPLIALLRKTEQEGLSEPPLPLWPFLGAEAIATVQRRRRELEARRFWDAWPSGIETAADEHVASVFGLKARDIYEARLSRVAFFHALETVAFGEHVLRSYFTIPATDRERDAAVELLLRCWATEELSVETETERDVAERVIATHRQALETMGMAQPHMPLRVSLDTEE